MKFLHFIEDFADRRAGRRGQQRAEAGEHGGIDGVSFGELSDGLGKSSGLAGVDLGHRQAGCRECSLEGAVIGTGRLENHTLHLAAFQPGHESAMALGIIGKAPGFAAGVDICIKEIF